MGGVPESEFDSMKITNRNYSSISSPFASYKKNAQRRNPYTTVWCIELIKHMAKISHSINFFWLIILNVDTTPNYLISIIHYNIGSIYKNLFVSTFVYFNLAAVFLLLHSLWRRQTMLHRHWNETNTSSDGYGNDF